MRGEKLTLKQQEFVKNYAALKGNGTKAALETYDTVDYNTAHAIASENLQKPTIQKAIRKELEGKSISLDYVLQNIKENMEAGKGVKASASDSLRAAELLLKVMGAFPNQKKVSTYISAEERYASMTKEELMQERGKQLKFYQEILGG